MNATFQMEVVNTIVITSLGASPAAVTQDTSWRKMDSTAVVRVWNNYIMYCIKALNYKSLVVLQTSMNATLQMEVVNTIVLTPLGVSSAAVTQGTSWMKMDWTAVVRVCLDLYALVHGTLQLYCTISTAHCTSQHHTAQTWQVFFQLLKINDNLECWH